MKWGLLIAGLAIVVAGLYAAPAHAEPSLQLEPLQYQETLKKAERKQGFIEVTNPSTGAVNVSFKVSGFRQVNDKGNLSFYEDARLREGIQLDASEATIPPKQTLRLSFVADGSKLPTGDVFAVIFAQTGLASGTMVPSVQLGTLLLLTNGTPSVHQAVITELWASWLQLGTSIDGQLTIENTAPAAAASGFFPQVTMSLWPFGPRTTATGPLVYAGNSRTVSFHLPSNQLGIYKLSAAYGASHKDRWIVVVTGVWRWVGLAGLVAVFGGLILWLRWGRRGRAKH